MRLKLYSYFIMLQALLPLPGVTQAAMASTVGDTPCQALLISSVELSDRLTKRLETGGDTPTLAETAADLLPSVVAIEKTLRLKVPPFAGPASSRFLTNIHELLVNLANRLEQKINDRQSSLLPLNANDEQFFRRLVKRTRGTAVVYSAHIHPDGPEMGLLNKSLSGLNIIRSVAQIRFVKSLVAMHLPGFQPSAPTPEEADFVFENGKAWAKVSLEVENLDLWPDFVLRSASRHNRTAPAAQKIEKLFLLSFNPINPATISRLERFQIKFIEL